MANPIVSVIMPSYNHAPYVVQAMRSVLAQDFKDFEFLIADDGSKDGTDEAIRTISDPRIIFNAYPRNRGAGVVTKSLIDSAKGEFVALINSDDAWLPGKLTYQVELMRNNPSYGAVFGRVRYIDHQNNGIPKSTMQWGAVFDKENRSRGEWLRHFFYDGNCLCNPSMMIRRKIFQTLGVYDNRLRQLPDFDMWIRLVKRYDLFISEKPLIEFRIMPGEANASGDTPRNAVRVINEYMMLAQTFFDDVDRETLIDGFSDLLKIKTVPTDIHLDIEKVLLLFTPAPWLDHMYKIVGLQKLYKLLASPSHRPVLAAEYGIDDREFQRLMGEADAFRPMPR
jgi:glycosyltransferase involved in cell wall biosynthesis